MNTETSQHAYREQMTVMLISLAVAVVLLGLKVWAAEVTNSTALYSDAAESVVHLVAVAIAVRALHLSHKPADGEHHFGHDKASYLSAGFEGAMICTAALLIYYDAGRSLFAGPHMEKLGIGASLAGLAMMINLVLGIALLRVGKKRQSPLLRANGMHVLSDVYTSVAVLFALGLVYFTKWPWWDPIMAALAATNILWTGVKLIRQSLGGLMDAAEPETEAKIRTLLDELMLSQPFTYHHLRHRHSGHTHWVELHLVVEDEMSVHDAHVIATKVEQQICDLLAPYGRIITHLEPRSAEETDEIWEGSRHV